jgi:hypothetical protein
LSFLMTVIISIFYVLSAFEKYYPYILFIK